MNDPEPVENTPTPTPLEANGESRDFSKALNKRVEQVKARYANFDQYKAAYEELQSLKERDKSELDKALERNQQLKAKLDALTKAQQVDEWKQQVSHDTSVPASLLTADTLEALQAQAEAIAEYAHPKPQAASSGQQGATPQGAQGSDWSSYVHQLFNK